MQAPQLDPVARIARAEAFFAATGVEVIHGGNMACYSVTHDHIRLPPFETFRDAESYYATLAHEATHATKHPKRFDRDFGRKRWGDEGYAMEELCAELGAAFVCADLALTPEVRDDHASYIASWLKVLKEDKRRVLGSLARAEGGGLLKRLAVGREASRGPESGLINIAPSSRLCSASLQAKMGFANSHENSSY